MTPRSWRSPRRVATRCATRRTGGCPGSRSPCALVIFGVTGDLARKKLLPAVYDLANRGLLPPGFVVLGFARRDWGDGDFETLAREAAQEHARTPWREEVWARLAGNIKFVGGSFDDDAAFDTLAATLDDLRDSPRHPRQRRVLPLHPAGGLPGGAQAAGSAPGWPTTRKSGGWRRVVVEKPFGNDLPARIELNDLVDDVFTRRTSSGSTTTWARRRSRTSSPCGSPTPCSSRVWNSKYVDSVQITMAEDVGIGTRAGFYDSVGTARDVLQNHLLQLLRPGGDGGADQLRRRRDPDREAQGAQGDHAARRTSPGTPSAGSTCRAGSAGERAVGYLEEDGVPADSTTETYVAVRLGIQNRRWAGVPFYIRAGKRLPRRVTEVAIMFKKAPHLPFNADRHEDARQQPAGHPGPAGRGRDAQVRLEGAGHHDGGPRHRRWTSSTARRSPSPAPRRTSGWCWTC